VGQGGEPPGVLDDALDRVGGQRESGVSAELGLEIPPVEGKVGTTARMVLALLEHAAVEQADPDVADELPRVIDRGIEVVADAAGDGEHAASPAVPRTRTLASRYGRLNFAA
jgi:hypothetical protein